LNKATPSRLPNNADSEVWELDGLGVTASANALLEELQAASSRVCLVKPENSADKYLVASARDLEDALQEVSEAVSELRIELHHWRRRGLQCLRAGSTDAWFSATLEPCRAADYDLTEFFHLSRGPEGLEK
jgi:hypothetical protein